MFRTQRLEQDIIQNCLREDIDVPIDYIDTNADINWLAPNGNYAENIVRMKAQVMEILPEYSHKLASQLYRAIVKINDEDKENHDTI